MAIRAEKIKGRTRSQRLAAKKEVPMQMNIQPV